MVMHKSSINLDINFQPVSSKLTPFIKPLGQLKVKHTDINFCKRFWLMLEFWTIQPMGENK